MEELNEKSFQLKQCQIHKNNKISILQFQNKELSHEMCYKCLVQYKIDPLSTLSIESVIGDDQDTIYYNYPPLANEELQNSLNEIEEEHFQIDSMIQKIKQFTSDLRENFEKLLVELEQKSKVQIIKFQELKDQVVEKYNKISSKQELKTLFQGNPLEINQKFKDMLENKEQEKEQNTEIIKESINSFVKMVNNFETKNADQIKQNILSQMRLISFFPVQEEINEERQDEGSENKKLNEFDSPLELSKEKIRNDKILYELISNKTNYCSDKALKTIHQILDKCKNQVNLYKIPEINNKRKASSFIGLNDEQLENIRELADTTQKISKKYQEPNQTYEKVQPISSSLQNCQLFNNVRMKNLLVKYPIFETVKINEYRAISNLKFVNSPSLSVQSSIYTQVVVGGSNSKGSTYLDFFLDPFKKYIFKIVIKYPNYTQYNSKFGLIPISKFSSGLQKYGICYADNDVLTEGINELIKGQSYPHYSPKKDAKEKELELRVHLVQNIIKVGDSNYSSVCKLPENQKVLIWQEISSFVFAVEINNTGDNIAIQSIHEVGEFDDKM